MRCIEGDVTKPRLFVFFDPALSFTHKDIGHVTLERLPLPIFLKVGIKHRAAPVVRRLTDPAATYEQRMVKSAVVGMEYARLAKMPLAKNAGAVAGFFKSIRHDRHAGPQQIPSLDRMSNRRTKLMSTGHESGTGRRASRTRDKIRESHAARRECIEIRSFKMGIALKCRVSKTLVIG